MKRIKRWVRSFFGFSRSQTNAFLLLLPLMVILIFAEPTWRYFVARRVPDYFKDRPKLDSLIALWNATDSITLTQDEHEEPIQLFSFDPNKTPVEDFMKTGLRKCIREKVRYREKGEC